MKKRAAILFSIGLVCWQKGLFGQVLLNIEPVFGDAPLALGSATAGGTTVSKLKFYLSKIELVRADGTVWAEPESFHLVDAQQPQSLAIRLDAPVSSWKEVRFCLGIDSLTNAEGAHGGDLDPARGMYWAWQSGYINFKCEGRDPRFASGRGGEFEFHLGGFLPPFLAAKKVSLPLLAGPSGEVRVGWDAKVFFEKLDFSSQPSIMSPSAEAVKLAGFAAGAFRVLR